jgi:type VI secretion system secreted protein VgrG
LATSQTHREVAVQSPLGADRLLFAALRGHEELGRLSEFELELLSESGSIGVDDVVGHLIAVRIDLPGGGSRWFNAYVTRFAFTGWRGKFATYAATLHHWLWLLTRQTNSRIFQDKTVVDILKEVFHDYPAHYDASLHATYPSLPYCVQYRETDFDFVSRLMEQAGIYYFFRQTQDSHTLVLADSPAAHDPIPGYAQLRYVPDGSRPMRGHEAVFDWTLTGALESGKVALGDFNFEKATASGAGILAARARLPGGHALASYERYDYPGDFATVDDGEAIARTRVEGLHAQYQRASARTSARGVFAGGLFDLVEHPRSDQNARYLVVASRYDVRYGGYETVGGAGGSLEFACDFTALDKKFTFRSEQVTPRPVVRGPQTAFVVGKDGEEIWTDQYGRVKLQFHWDRQGASDEKSSCWVRVAQPLAGKRWGAVFLPRIGQEAVVEFLEGDPDRPLVTGTVYNAGMMPPYSLPENASRTVLRSNSSKGGATYNEIRLEDKAGSEQLFLFAGRQQDNNVVKDSLLTVGGDRHAHVKGNELAKVDGDRSDTVTGACKGKVGNGFSLDVGKDAQIKLGTNLAASAGQNVDFKGGVNVTIEAGMTLTLKAGSSTIVLGPSGVAINGTMVTIDGSAMVSINGGGGGGASSAQSAQPQSPDGPKDADDGKS